MFSRKKTLQESNAIEKTSFQSTSENSRLVMWQIRFLGEACSRQRRLRRRRRNHQL